MSELWEMGSLPWPTLKHKESRGLGSRGRPARVSRSEACVLCRGACLGCAASVAQLRRACFRAERVAEHGIVRWAAREAHLAAIYLGEKKPHGPGTALVQRADRVRSFGHCGRRPG